MYDRIIAPIVDRFKKNVHPEHWIWYVFVVILLAITWSGVKAVQTNYNLQKQISQLRQQNTVLQLQNENISLNNQYLNSGQYQDLAARQDLGLASPGESVLLVPESTAMKYVDPNLTVSSTSSSQTQAAKSQPRVVKNLEAWRDFLLGRTILSN